MHLSAVNHIAPPSAETVPQPEPSPPLAESRPSKEVSSFSSSTSSPWDSPENPVQALKPVPARARSAPITLPTEPVDPVDTPAEPSGVDAFSSLSWSQSQWIAFNDHFALPRRQGSSAKDLHRPRSSSVRSSRFLSDGSADASCTSAGSRDDGESYLSDVFSGAADKTMAAAPSSQAAQGNTTAARDSSCA